MKISLKNRTFISFLTVIILTNSITTFVGIKLIGKSIIPRVQDHVRLDLNSAREIYQKTVEDVRNVIRFTAIRFFIKDALVYDDFDGLTMNLNDIMQNESLDILNITDSDGKVLLRVGNPEEKGDNQASKEIIKKVIDEKHIIASSEILSEDEVKKEGMELNAQAYTRIVPTPHALSTNKVGITSGMFIMAAAPILNDENEILGILYGGKLLNHNYNIVDQIRDTVFESKKYDGKDVGVVTIFLRDIRISTNVKTENGDRALGTIISEDVNNYVLMKGNQWIERAFVVDDWYITAYEPIKNISGEIIGILGLGVLENEYKDMQKKALRAFFGIAFGGIVLSMMICFFLTKTIMRPINYLLLATQNLANGNLDQQVQLKNAPKEIDFLGKAFNYMVSSIKERDEELRQKAQEEIMKSERLAMVGQLAAGVAHEINNPLGGVLLFSGLLLKKAPPEGVMRENLERIEKEAKRCQNIVQGLLDFARERDPKMEKVQINDIVDKSVNLFENQPMFHNIEIVKQYQPEIPEIIADPSQIQQVFVNIIINAADAMNGKGVLSITTSSSTTDDTVQISFADTGRGMSSEQLSRVFEPFYTTKGVGYGTGLGLSISYGVIHRHDGQIKAFSQEGRGSTFIVMLPKIKEKS